MNIITFLTDFGRKDGYVAQMKGVVLGITDARCLDLSHEVTPHDVREGAYILRSVVPFYPTGTVHVAVVDPGVGTTRRGLVVTTRTQILIGPDNGLLMPAAHFLGDFVVYEISNREYMVHPVSSTFHGRDIFAPVAAYITTGVPFEEIGCRVTDFVDLEFGRADVCGQSILGRVIYIDSFGNIITNITQDVLSSSVKYDSKIMVFLGESCRKIPFVRSYGFVKKREMLATVGSSGFLEIGVNQGNAAKKLSVKVDDEVKVLFG